MAILDGIHFTGSIGGMSAYRMKGSDKIILRSKGGASKQKIKEAPEFELPRKNIAEFGGCGKAAASIRKAIYPVKHLADYNFTPTLSALSKTIQVMDTESLWGERAIYFSRHRFLLEGFHLNKKNTFDSVVRHPLGCVIERGTGSAVVQLPNLLPEQNLRMPWQYPYFRFTIGLGVVADRTYHGASYEYTDPHPRQYPHPCYLHTEWQMAKQPFAAQSITLQLNQPENLDDAATLLLFAGIEMGTPVSDQLTIPVKYAGCAKIVAVG
jgi:hypothetical protein